MSIIKLVCCAVGLVLAMPWYASASIIATTEQGRFDINTGDPLTSAPIGGVIQTGSLTGGNFTNSYGMNALNQVLVRTVGVIPFTQVTTELDMYQVVRGPGSDNVPLLLAFALEGVVDFFDPVSGASIALFQTGTLGAFQRGSGTFSGADPSTWLPPGDDFDNPLIEWVLRDPLPIFAGEGSQLGTIEASEVNRSGSNVSAGTLAQGTFLFEEQLDPNYNVTTPGQDGFLDVTTGHNRFIGPTTEGVMVITSQTTSINYTPNAPAARRELDEDQQDVLNLLSNWGLGVDFATSFHQPGDPTGFNPLSTPGNRIIQYNPFTGEGGDFFSNQDSVLTHPTLFGSVIPEPGTFAIWGLGLISVAAYARKQQKSKKNKAAQ